MNANLPSTSVNVSLGNIIACIISYSLNHSFWWMLWHGLCGWFYIIYWAIFL